jgi:hypothetical protein
MKFRGHKSEGFYIPLSSLWYTGILKEQKSPIFPEVGDVFDQIGDHEICRKYVPAHNPAKLSTNQAKGTRVRLEDSIVDNQFRLHADTANLRRNSTVIQPDDLISISDKWHGTSVVLSNLLVKRELNLLERILRKIGVKVQETEYGLVYSSRKVIKSVNGASKANKHYYSSDIWGAVAKEVQDKIPAGFSLYGEIVGNTADGSAIQRGYHYGCLPTEHQLLVYRVTMTNADGLAIELSWTQLLEFCEKYALHSVHSLFYGHAQEWLSIGDQEEISDWQQRLLTELEKAYVRDQMCEHNLYEVPAEGIVVRVDRLMGAEAFKLKSFLFLKKESDSLDAGILDVETVESEELAIA